jgi:site-specific recombinase XerD
MSTLPEPLDIGVENGKFSDPILRLDTDLRERTVSRIRGAKAAATRRAYEADWALFAGWCGERGIAPLPADPRAVAAFLADLERHGAKAATIRRKLSAISVRHRIAGHDSPRKSWLVAEAMEGIQREIGVGQVKKAPARTGDVRTMVATLNTSRLIGARDRALLVLGFAGAFRRSELVAFDVGDLVERGDWLYAHVRRSKTDQKGEGAKVAMPWGGDPLTCPVRSLRAWLSASGITEGPVFRPVTKGGRLGDTRLSDRAVAKIVKRTAEAAGMNPDSYAGHSLRSGFITSAAENETLERHIMRHSRHNSVTVVRGYMDEADLTRDNAAANVGL